MSRSGKDYSLRLNWNLNWMVAMTSMMRHFSLLFCDTFSGVADRPLQ